MHWFTQLLLIILLAVIGSELENITKALTELIKTLKER